MMLFGLMRIVEIVASILGLLCLPFLIIVVIRPIIFGIGSAVHWIATYPKGAWAGLVWILTLALGILRLFF